MPYDNSANKKWYKYSFFGNAYNVYKLQSLDDDEPTDKIETVTLYVSGETGSMIGLTGVPHECMLVKEKGQTTWNPWEFEGINGFTYEKGFDYELLVTKPFMRILLLMGEVTAIH